MKKDIAYLIAAQEKRTVRGRRDFYPRLAFYTGKPRIIRIVTK